MNGRVIDKLTGGPLANVLVIANVQISFEDGMSGQVASPKSVKTAYCLTDTNGTFSIAALNTRYLHFATVMRSRDADGGIIGAYLPNYEYVSKSRTNEDFVVYMAPSGDPQKFVRGLNFVLERTRGFRIKPEDRAIFEELFKPHISDKNGRRIK